MTRTVGDGRRRPVKGDSEPSRETDYYKRRGVRDSPGAMPVGWFAVARAAEVRIGKILPATLRGREIVVYRTAAGRLVAAEAYCPHLGAHLGVGGSVCGELIRCPFHGLEFDPSGTCVGTPYGRRAPTTARLGMLPVTEKYGAVFVFDGDGWAAPWTLSPDDSGVEWPSPSFVTLAVATHPQETTENSVDYGHFAEVHGFEDFRVIRRLEADGPSLTMRYTTRRAYGGSYSVVDDYRIKVDGLGISVVYVDVGKRWRVRQLILATPVCDGHTLLRIGTSAIRTGEARTPVGSHAARAAAAVFQRIALAVVLREVGRDKKIWERKKYLAHPAIADGDGPIGRYRKWCQQFYRND